uniref:Uncharacterized protein n=1 Tax=Setaria viridis TaxID=4556 RepID=A0A4U6T636_SETVI|nr:hypothetical protein SEVIR_9G479300v2 [Setaria viridis]
MNFISVARTAGVAVPFARSPSPIAITPGPRGGEASDLVSGLRGMDAVCKLRRVSGVDEAILRSWRDRETGSGQRSGAAMAIADRELARLRLVSATAPRSYSSLTMDFNVANPPQKEYRVDGNEKEMDRVRWGRMGGSRVEEMGIRSECGFPARPI